jgi:hypothetical protein
MRKRKTTKFADDVRDDAFDRTASEFRARSSPKNDSMRCVEECICRESARSCLSWGLRYGNPFVFRRSDLVLILQVSYGLL